MSVRELRAAFVAGAVRMNIIAHEQWELDKETRDVIERASRVRFPEPSAPDKMTDQELAKSIRAATDLLTIAVQAALDAGLSVEVESHDVQRFAHSEPLRTYKAVIRRSTVIRSP